jgi:indole-3-glycerol phosphate synthase
MGMRNMRFSEALIRTQKAGNVPVISEIKCVSPKHGDLLRGRDPIALARMMESAGAACISVVTEPDNFGGSLELLRMITAAVSVPVLRKDFIRTHEDVRATKEAGADCMLLIAALLEWPRLVELHHAAHEYGLETLVEVHNRTELFKALELQLDLLGINNKDITVLEKDDGTIENTIELIRSVPPGVLVVSESGISTPDEVRSVIDAGACAVLVGTSILTATDVSQAVRCLVKA